MTENNTPSVTVAETTTAVERQRQPDTKQLKEKHTNLWSNVVIIGLVILLSGGLFYNQHQQHLQLQTTNKMLQEQLTALAKSQSLEKNQSANSLQQHGKSLEVINRQQASLEHQLHELQQKVSTISGTDAKIWLLAQADFLVKMAGRKLWGDQDVTTAAVLLKSADTSLAEMKDPALLEVRRAITQDINTLAVINQIDFDGIILKVNQLSNQIDNLRLADNNNDDSPMDTENYELSGSVSEWRQNIRKSWDSFMSNFITIRRRDSNAEPLLAPHQDVYLRENIRARLLIAAQAIPRHQDELYRQSLENVSTWVRAYFDVNDSNTKVFLEELDYLSQQSITMEVPEQLISQALLEKLMQKRVRNLLSSPTIN